MAWKDKTKYQKTLAISVLSLIALNIILAIAEPLLLPNKDLVTFLYVFQWTLLLPITSAVFLMAAVDLLVGKPRRESKAARDRAAKDDSRILGTFTLLGIGVVAQLIYAAIVPHSGMYMSITQVIMMAVFMIIAIVAGPCVGRIYRKPNIIKNHR